MFLQRMSAEEIVMEYGDIGINFYLILAGEVEIVIPDPNQKKVFLQRRKGVSRMQEELQDVQLKLERTVKNKAIKEKEKEE